MTTEDFITKWNGKYVDTDNAYGAQCMDLLHQFCVEVLGLSQDDLAAPCAKDVYTNFSNVQGHDKFDKIDNTPTGVPQEGDIVFWVNDPYGHVAIFHDGDANQFKSFDQNYPTGSPCHIQQHTYANVGGWLRFKGTQNLQDALSQCNHDRDVHWNDLQAIKTQLSIVGDYSLTLIQNRIDSLLSTERNYGAKEQALEQAQKDLQAAQADAKTKGDELLALKADIDQKTQEWSQKVQDAISENQRLSRALQEAESATKVPDWSGWQFIAEGINKLLRR